MSTFSQTYINSSIVRSLIESVPEAERPVFLEHLRITMEQYDHFSGLSWDKSSIAEALRGGDGDQVQQGGRRPPRRS